MPTDPKIFQPPTSPAILPDQSVADEYEAQDRERCLDPMAVRHPSPPETPRNYLDEFDDMADMYEDD